MHGITDRANALHCFDSLVCCSFAFILTFRHFASILTFEGLVFGRPVCLESPIDPVWLNFDLLKILKPPKNQKKNGNEIIKNEFNIKYSKVSDYVYKLFDRKISNLISRTKIFSKIKTWNENWVLFHKVLKFYGILVCKKPLKLTIFKGD